MSTRLRHQKTPTPSPEPLAKPSFWAKLLQPLKSQDSITKDRERALPEAPEGLRDEDRSHEASDGTDRGLWEADVLDMMKQNKTNVVPLFPSPVCLTKPTQFQWNPTTPVIDLPGCDVKKLNGGQGWAQCLFNGWTPGAKLKEKIPLNQMRPFRSPFPGTVRVPTTISHTTLSFDIAQDYTHTAFAAKLKDDKTDGCIPLTISDKQLRHLFGGKRMNPKASHHFLPHQITLTSIDSNFKVAMDMLLVSGHHDKKSYVTWMTGEGLSNSADVHRLFRGKTYCPIPGGEYHADYSSNPRAVYLAENCVNEPEFHRWIGFIYERFTEQMKKFEHLVTDENVVIIPLPHVDDNVFSMDMCLTWFVLEELGILRILVEEGGQYHTAFKNAMAAYEKAARTLGKFDPSDAETFYFTPTYDPSVLPDDDRGDKRYFIRVFKPALLKLIEDKKSRYNRDKLLLNANEGITLLLRPLAGKAGAECYEKIAHKDQQGVADRDDHVHFNVRLTVTFEDYVDESLIMEEEKKRQVGLLDATARDLLEHDKPLTLAEAKQLASYSGLIKRLQEAAKMVAQFDKSDGIGIDDVEVNVSTRYDPFTNKCKKCNNGKCSGRGC